MDGSQIADAQIAAPSTVITRRQPAIVYAANSQTIIPISRNMFTRGMYLNLTATPTLTGVNNSVANTAYGDEWGCVAKIELIANGATTLFSCAGADLKPLSRILTGKRARILPQLGDGATANPVLDSTVYIPFLNPRSRRPFDTILFAADLSDLRLVITWTADWTTINTAATAWTTQPAMVCYTREQSAPIDKRTGKVIIPNFFRRMLKIPVQITGANAAFQKQLNTGPAYRGIIVQEMNAGGTADSSTILTNIKVSAGATTYADMAANALYEKARQEWKIDDEEFVTPASGIWYQSKGAVNNSASPLAWRFLDFCEDGYMSEVLDTLVIGDTYLEFNVNAATTINLFTQELLRINR